jgi:hypothetical protein
MAWFDGLQKVITTHRTVIPRSSGQFCACEKTSLKPAANSLQLLSPIFAAWNSKGLASHP